MPGQAGTKRLVQQYGDRLFCVRYRYDTERRMRYKTAEIIVSEAPWQPPATPEPAPSTAPARRSEPPQPADQQRASADARPAASAKPADTPEKSFQVSSTNPNPRGHLPLHPREIVFLSLDPSEAHYHAAIKDAGGHWHPTSFLWYIPYAKAVMINMEHKIVAVARRR